MLIYNVTSNIPEALHEKWLLWMQKTHIPEVIATGKFSKARLVKVLVDEEDTVTYSVQFFTDCKSNLEKYLAEDSPRIREHTKMLFGDEVLTFRTELQLISDHTAV